MSFSQYSCEMVDFRHKIAVLMPLLLATNAPAATAADVNAPAWSYDGEKDGQEQWALLSPTYAACETSTKQSPIQVSFTKIVPPPRVDVRYAPANAHLNYANRTIQILFDDELVVFERNHPYRLKRIEFHTPGEHMVKDKFYPVEIHLIHEDNQGRILIVAIFATQGAELPALQPVLDHAPSGAGLTFNLTFDPRSLLPASNGYYAYAGSLTYPPCTEGVQWRILKEPITISQAQFIQLTKILGRNARLPQPIYMRKIRETR